MNTSDDDFTDAFLQNQVMEALEGYRKRGRALEKLDDDALEQRWIASMKAWAAAISAGHAYEKGERDDAQAEMSLRGIKPPLGKVSVEWQKIVAAVKATIADPVRRERVTDSLVDDLAGFETSGRRKPPN